jgi:hypothetical protein
MINQTVFEEMMDKEFITNVGLKNDDFESVEDLMDHGIITSVAGGKEYNVEPTVVEVLIDEKPTDIIPDPKDDIIKDAE